MFNSAASVSHPWASYEGSCFSTFSLIPVIFSIVTIIFTLVSVEWYLAFPQCLRTLNIFCCAYCIFVYLPWSNSYLSVLPIFNWIVCLLLVSFRSYLYIPIRDPYQLFDLQIFLFYRLSSDFLDSVLWYTVVLNFYGPNFLLFLLFLAFFCIMYHVYCLNQGQEDLFLCFLPRVVQF